MKCVILESPFTGKDKDRNLTYARCAMKDCLNRGEAPLASHLLYTQPYLLDDNVKEERAKGISAGFAWGKYADCVVVYTDLGISGGMVAAIEIYKEIGLPIIHRTLTSWGDIKNGTIFC